MNPKPGLPSGCYRLLSICDQEEPVRLDVGDLNMAKVLAAKGLLELLPGCSATFSTTDSGRKALEDRR